MQISIAKRSSGGVNGGSEHGSLGSQSHHLDADHDHDVHRRRGQPIKPVDFHRDQGQQILELELELELVLVLVLVLDLPKGRDPVILPQDPLDILLQGIMPHRPPKGRMQEALAQDRRDDHLSKSKRIGTHCLLGQ